MAKTKKKKATNEQTMAGLNPERRGRREREKSRQLAKSFLDVLVAVDKKYVDKDEDVVPGSQENEYSVRFGEKENAGRNNAMQCKLYHNR